ncbi:recombination mediator RecR [Candidatus Parcubacteria bacterium]|nr:recombination mediator RecR [Candidatus Parcubacteria bacterium]
MNSIDKLTELFKQFPGIGPRQAKRFVYYLLSRNASYTSELMQAVQELKKEITQCDKCFKFFIKNQSSSKSCSICSDESRDASMLMVVPRDIDLEAVEKSGSFRGYYFVLGGVVPILEKEPERKIRITNLESRIKSDTNIKEVILAMNANNDGEHTVEYLKDQLKNLSTSKLIITVLGRGLSTGAELEYADPETLKNAFLHRTK